MKTEELTDVAARAVEEMERHGWTSWCHDPERLCPLQALAVAMGRSRLRWTDPAVIDVGMRLYAPIIRRDYPGRLALAGREEEVVWVFNDDPRTHAFEVLRVMQEASA